VVWEGDAGFAAPEGVAEEGAEMPGHDVGGGEGAAGEVVVVVEGGGEEFDAGAGAGEGAEVVFGFGEAGGFEVDDGAEVFVVPDLVAAVEVAVDEY
jgi:hypothetical protein